MVPVLPWRCSVGAVRILTLGWSLPRSSIHGLGEEGAA